MPEDPLTANIESPQIQILSVVEPSTPDAHSPLLGSPCIICQKQLAKKHCTPVSRLKPRFLKLMQLHFPKTAFRPTDSICKDHFATALQSRVDDLLEEDQFESSKLQEEAMKNIEKYEMEELTWKRTNC